MGRPKKQNPKNKHIGIVTTEEKFRRFKALGLVGDEAIDVLLFHLEKDNTKLRIQKSQHIRRIKELESRIDALEFEVLQEKTKLDQVNIQLGESEDLGNDVHQAIDVIMERYENVSDVYSLTEFLELKKNHLLVISQANFCNMELDDFKDLVRSNAES